MSWCILQMSAPRTLRVVQSLRTAGFDVWAPSATVRRHIPRSHKYRDIEIALLPTFAFAQGDHLSQLLAIIHDPRSDHPAFSLFHGRDGQPYVGAINLQPLRAYEARKQQEWDALLATIAREAKLRTKKSRARAYVLGQRVRVEKSAWAGLIGKIVEKRHNGDLVLEFTGYSRDAVVASCDVEAIQLSEALSEQDKAA